MKITVAHERSLPAAKASLLVVGVAGKKALTQDPAITALDEALSGHLRKALAHEKFEGKRGQAVVIHSLGALGADKVRVVGLPTDVELEHAAYRLGVLSGRASRERKSVMVVAPSGDASVLSALAQGLQLGCYRYTSFFSDTKPARTKVTLLVDKAPTAAQRKAVTEGVAVAESVAFARDLVNCPPNEMNAPALAEAARKMAEELGLECTLWGKKQIEKRGMRLLSAVNAGSREEPRFIHVAYKPAGKRKKSAVPRLVFVGKGLTFDAGGLCIKPGKSMETMKCDMAGGAATLGVIAAAAKLKLPVEVHAVVPSTDNMLGDNAYRPGDVYKSLDGKTVEIINTDAEGRLILADALVYARELEPTVLVDHATLTGAAMVALGQWTAALYSNRDALSTRYAEAAKRAGESYWPMPLLEDLRETLKSPIADLKHTGDPYGGSISAALFLREFVGDCDWIHLDIAGPAFLSGAHDLEPRGGTGFGVRTALEFIRSYAE